MTCRMLRASELEEVLQEGCEYFDLYSRYWLDLIPCLLTGCANQWRGGTNDCGVGAVSPPLCILQFVYLK